MKPKYRYPVSEKATIPEALAAYYVEKDGFLVLDIDGAGDAAALNQKIQEFRTNNTKAKEDLEEIAALATGKDPAAFKGMAKEAIVLEINTHRDAAEKAGSAKTKTEIEAAAEAKITAMKTAHQNELNKISAERATLQQERDARSAELATLKIHKAVLDEATKLGARPEALDDIAARAAAVFSLDDKGVPVARKGDTPLFDPATGEALTVQHFAKSLTQTAKHLFVESTGSGSEGGSGGKPPGAVNGENPWDPKHLNRTRQNKRRYK